jgi:hypothetical protein
MRRRRVVALAASLGILLLAVAAIAVALSGAPRSSAHWLSYESGTLITADMYGQCREALLATDTSGVATVDSLSHLTLDELARSDRAVLFEGDTATAIDTTSEAEVERLIGIYSKRQTANSRSGTVAVVVTGRIDSGSTSTVATCLVEYEHGAVDEPTVAVHVFE